ncbi:MAG: carbohydrate ABC transporter permease [Spirochaetaceae bacterium]
MSAKGGVMRRGTAAWVFLGVVIVLVLGPVYWMVATSLKTPREVIRPQPTLWPETVTVENYISAVEAGVSINFYNSVFVATLSVGISIVVAFFAAYALARHRFPLKLNAVFLMWILAVRILPPIVVAVPLYAVFNEFGLMNTRIGLVIAYQVYTLPYSVWIIFGFVRALPLEFEEQAILDGAGRFRVLVSVIAPLIRGGVVATSIFALVTAWNEFLFALVFVRRPALLTLPVVISRYIGEYTTLWGELMAIGLLATIPILLFSGYVYRRLTTGFSLSLK